MVTISEALLVLTPTALAMVDYQIKDDGSGPVLTWLSQSIARPTDAAIAAVTQQQVDAARLAVNYSQSVATALSATDPISKASRADSVLAHTYLNDTREEIAAILSLIGKAPADLQAQIVANRAGKTFEQTPTDPGAMVADLRRIPESEIVARLSAAIHAGYGDPISN